MTTTMGLQARSPNAFFRGGGVIFETQTHFFENLPVLDARPETNSISLHCLCKTVHIAEIGLLLAFVVWSECVFVSRDSFCSMVADAIL